MVLLRVHSGLTSSCVVLYIDSLLKSDPGVTPRGLPPRRLVSPLFPENGHRGPSRVFPSFTLVVQSVMTSPVTFSTRRDSNESVRRVPSSPGGLGVRL